MKHKFVSNINHFYVTWTLTYLLDRSQFLPFQFVEHRSISRLQLIQYDLWQSLILSYTGF